MDTIILNLYWICLITIILVPILIVINLFINGASTESPSSGVIIKSALAFVAWIAATFWLAIIWIALSLPEAPFSKPREEWRPPITYIWVDLGYLLLMVGLVYWVWRKKKTKLP